MLSSKCACEEVFWQRIMNRSHVPDLLEARKTRALSVATVALTREVDARRANDIDLHLTISMPSQRGEMRSSHLRRHMKQTCLCHGNDRIVHTSNLSIPFLPSHHHPSIPPSRILIPLRYHHNHAKSYPCQSDFLSQRPPLQALKVRGDHFQI